MQIYLLLFKNAWQVGWSYRGSLIIKALVDIIFTVAYILLWSILYKSRSEIAGFTFPDIVTYYILIRILDLFYTFYPAKYLTSQTKTGKLSSFLVKPVNFFNYSLSNALGLKMARGFVTIILIITFFIFFPQYVVFPPNVLYLLFLIPFGLLSWLIYFEMAFIIGISSFWVSETGNLRTAFAQIISLLSGGWFPLSFFPPFILVFINYLPIKFLYFYLIQLYLGKIPLNNLVFDLIQCFLWVVVLYLIGKYFFQVGIRRYESYGN